MFYGLPKFTATSRQDYNRRCFGCLVPRPRTEVKREAGDSRSIHIDGHSGTAPRCCKPDDSGNRPLCNVLHGKAPEKYDGESEDRPGTNVVPIPGVTGEVLMVCCTFSLQRILRP